jgi:acyl carrier protein
MSYSPIAKPTRDWTVAPNLLDYERERTRDFWERARGELTGLPGGGLNIAHEAVDRHAAGPRRNHLALRWRGKRDEVRDFTYVDLQILTNRFANTVLRMLGEIAPEADLAQVKPDVDFRDQFDLDSMDLLNFVIAVDEELGVEIPESDYARLGSLDAFVGYLGERLGVPASEAR